MSKKASPVPAEALTTDGKPGVKASYSEMKGVDIFDPTKKPAALATRVEPSYQCRRAATAK